MARIRSIKPEFWTAEQIMECSPYARLAFIGMWTFCDDAGIHPASFKTLKAEVFPSDDITTSQVAEMVDELIKNELIEQYEVGGREYWAVTGWHHQKIDQPTFKHPRPDGTVPEGAPKRRAEKQKDASSANVREVFDEQSANVREVFTPGVEWSGVERIGEEWSKPVELTEVQTSTHETPVENSTRTGSLCKQLRILGYDAAPHLAAWSEILPLFSDAEIMEVAKATRDKKPGERLHLNYLVPILKDKAIPNARASPPRNGRQSRIDNYAAEAAAARGENGQQHSTGRTERDITGESIRVA